MEELIITNKTYDLEISYLIKSTYEYFLILYHKKKFHILNKSKNVQDLLQIYDVKGIIFKPKYTLSPVELNSESFYIITYKRPFCINYKNKDYLI